jgi:thioredoxin reductase (NADPH)
MAATKPTILAVDDDTVVSQAIVRDLRRRYGGDYRIIPATSGAAALDLLHELTLRDRSVALVVSDQRMPEMTGIEMLAEVRRLSPDSKLLLLTAYADTDVAIKAINDIALDYYMFKPWDPPEEQLYPVVDGLLDDWSSAHPPEASLIRVLGHRWSERSYEVKTFLARNHVPYRWLDLERDEEAQRLLELAGRTVDDLPLGLVTEGDSLAAPTSREQGSPPPSTPPRRGCPR